MSLDKHEVVEVVAELSAKLAARSRHVCLLIGAGASVGAGLPDLAGLTAKVLGSFAGDDLKLVEALLVGRNIESALTRLRRIESLVEAGETIAGFDKTTATRLDVGICQAIIEAIRTGSGAESFRRLGAWAGRADYRGPIEIFTTNYDLLLESGLEFGGVSYFDGFTGHLRGSFRPDLVETVNLTLPGQLPASFVRLWKLHGSSNWVWEDTAGVRRIVRLGDHAPAGSTVAVFPSDEKYDDSRRVPFVVLMDRFRRALAEPETLLLISGFSFSDQHLNEIIFEAACRRPRSEFVATCYGAIPATLKTEALRTRNLTVLSATEAIIGGRLAEFHADTDITGIWESNKCRIGDFGDLAAFLDRQANPVDLTVP